MIFVNGVLIGGNSDLEAEKADFREILLAAFLFLSVLSYALL